MDEVSITKDSSEYAEILSEVFVETVQKSASEAICHETEEITPSLVECLQYVYLHGASPIRKIADGMEISISAGSQLVERLVKKELVTRKDNETDRRSAWVEVTSEGRNVIRDVRRRRSEWFELIFDAMPDDKRHAFLEGLDSFLEVALKGDEDLDRNCVRCGQKHAEFCVVNKLKSERTEGGH